MYSEGNKSRYDERKRDDLLDEILSNSGIRGRIDGASCPFVGAERVEKSFGLEGYPLAMVYSPIQEWRELYDIETALERGTLFSALDLPFVCGERGNTSSGG